jgi:hypothetical protein
MTDGEDPFLANEVNPPVSSHLAMRWRTTT